MKCTNWYIGQALQTIDEEDKNKPYFALKVDNTDVLVSEDESLNLK